MISGEAIEEFKEIYEKKYDEELDDETAQKRARKLFNLAKAIYKPEPEHTRGNQEK